MPFGSAKEALKNATTLGYLNAAQALADYAAILVHVKEKYSAKHSPIIVVGASYGGSKSTLFYIAYLIFLFNVYGILFREEYST